MKKRYKNKHGLLFEIWTKDEFNAHRYKNFKQKQAMLARLPDSFYHMTDLDEPCVETGKPMREMIVCDWCNEYIEQSHVVIGICKEGREESMVRVWHTACVQDTADPPKELLQDIEKGSQGNVVRLFEGKNENE